MNGEILARVGRIGLVALVPVSIMYWKNGLLGLAFAFVALVLPSAYQVFKAPSGTNYWDWIQIGSQTIGLATIFVVGAFDGAGLGLAGAYFGLMFYFTCLFFVILIDVSQISIILRSSEA